MKTYQICIVIFAAFRNFYIWRKRRQVMAGASKGKVSRDRLVRGSRCRQVTRGGSQPARGVAWFPGKPFVHGDVLWALLRPQTDANDGGAWWRRRYQGHRQCHGTAGLLCHVALCCQTSRQKHSEYSIVYIFLPLKCQIHKGPNYTSVNFFLITVKLFQNLHKLILPLTIKL